MSLITIIGLLHILGAVGYFALSIGQIIVIVRSGNAYEIAFRVLKLIFVPLILFLSGRILIMNGWRLDPVLSTQVLLMTVLVAYFIFRELKK
jgi:hypothetical protein